MAVRMGLVPASSRVSTRQLWVLITATLPSPGMLTNTRRSSGVLAQSSPTPGRMTVVYSRVRPNPFTGSITTTWGERASASR
jgi:hypothetical protein